jgi:hypothetical protein
MLVRSLSLSLLSHVRMHVHDDDLDTTDAVENSFRMPSLRYLQVLMCVCARVHEVWMCE